MHRLTGTWRVALRTLAMSLAVAVALGPLPANAAHRADARTVSQLATVVPEYDRTSSTPAHKRRKSDPLHWNTDRGGARDSSEIKAGTDPSSYYA